MNNIFKWLDRGNTQNSAAEDINPIYKGLAKRRSRYALKREIPVSEEKLKSLVEKIVTVMPSPFNIQSTRMVIQLGKDHDKVWDIALDELKKVMPADAFEGTREKVNTSFRSGYGTILFYEDDKVVRDLKAAYPSYAHNFDSWSAQTNGMHQLALWSALADEGIGASLQHYTELIDEPIRKEWNIPADWKMYAQMPFGTAIDGLMDKEIQPISGRVIYHKSK